MREHNDDYQRGYEQAILDMDEAAREDKLQETIRGLTDAMQNYEEEIYELRTRLRYLGEDA